jgi:class 3 adenylate cyclase
MKSKPSREKSKPGIACFIDLHDSTHLWNRNADLAEKAIRSLSLLVTRIVKKEKGVIGNFTGDGFLILFEGTPADQAIKCISEIIIQWEVLRRQIVEEFNKQSTVPDEHMLSIRTGLYFGTWRELDGKRRDVAGPAINMAQRCEAASKSYLAQPAKTLFGEKTTLKIFNRIFVHQNVHHLIRTHLG